MAWFGEHLSFDNDAHEIKRIPERTDKLEEKNELLETTNKLKQEIEIANNNMFKLISPYPELLSHIGKEIQKDPQKNQLFLLCWYIAWETEKYLKENDKILYNEAKPILEWYIKLVNEAMQWLGNIEFYETFKDFAEKIKNEAPKKRTERRKGNLAFTPTNWGLPTQDVHNISNIKRTGMFKPLTWDIPWDTDIQSTIFKK